MTVRILNKVQQAIIIREYQDKKLNQKEIAYAAGVSERTINRVLIEAGVATPVARIKGDAYKVMALLRSYNVTYDQLATILNVRHGYACA